MFLPAENEMKGPGNDGYGQMDGSGVLKPRNSKTHAY